MRKLYVLNILVAFVYFQSYSQTYTIITSPNPASGSLMATSNAFTPNGNTIHATLKACYLVDGIDLSTSIPSSNTDISSLGFVYTNSLLSTPANGTITVYLSNTSDLVYSNGTAWSTATVGMTQVYSGILNIPTGTLATTIDLNFPTNFQYGGNGLYVAYDYVGATYETNYSVTAVYKGTFVLPTQTMGVFGGDAVFTDPENMHQDISRPEFRLGLAHSVSSSIHENEKPNECLYDVYPNPCNNNLKIDNKSGMEEAELSISNLMGKVLVSKKLTVGLSEINVEEINSGIYILTINGKKEKVVKRLVIER